MFKRLIKLAKIDELDVDKLKIVPTDLSKLSNVVDDDVVKKDVYYEYFKK